MIQSAPENRQVNLRTLTTHAKAGCRLCNGQGYMTVFRPQQQPRLEPCRCAVKGYVKSLQREALRQVRNPGVVEDKKHG